MVGMPTADDDPSQGQAEGLREPIENAVAFVEGARSVQTFAARTYEDLVDAFLERATGKPPGGRLNARDRIERVYADLLGSVEAIKSLPDEAFRRPDEGEDVNTPV